MIQKYRVRQTNNGRVIVKYYTTMNLFVAVSTCLFRSQAIGIASFAGRIGNLLAPFTSLMVWILQLHGSIH